MVVGLVKLVVVASAIDPAALKTVDVLASEVVLPWDVVDETDVGSRLLTLVVGGTKVGVDSPAVVPIVVVGLTELVIVASVISTIVVRTVDVMASEVELP